MNTFYWHDYETTGVDSAWDRPLQFAGLRTDEDLNPVGEPLNLYCRFPVDRLPNIEALLVNGLTPAQCEEKGLSEYEFAKTILAELSQPNTCGVGYNNIGFDDNVTRHLFWRNLLPPYDREYRGGNSRFDAQNLTLLAYALRPAGVVWPDSFQVAGAPSLRLTDLAAVNGITQEHAHDALSDVKATIGWVKLLKETNPELFRYMLNLRDKKNVIRLLALERGGMFLHVNRSYGIAHRYTGFLTALGPDPVNKNRVWSVNLGVPEVVEKLLNLAPEEMAAQIDTYVPHEAPMLVKLDINKMPVVAPLKVLAGSPVEHLWDRTTESMNQMDVMTHPELVERVKAALLLLGVRRQEKQAAQPDDPEMGLYSGGFTSYLDSSTMARLHADSDPSQYDLDSVRFQDPRLSELLYRCRARSWPEQLSPAETAKWEQHCRDWLAGSSPKPEQNWQAWVEGMEAKLPGLSETQQSLLKETKAWFEERGKVPLLSPPIPPSP